jgi:hypothetical protein
VYAWAAHAYTGAKDKLKDTKQCFVCFSLIALSFVSIDVAGRT